MSIDTLGNVLLWSGIINFGMLAIWSGAFFFGRRLMHRVSRWAGVTDEHFDMIQYAGIIFYKICIFMFFLIPYVALRFVK
ncbi:DUF6868 family protein [Tundrisphaera lichenicola]|uniref:DUF6868 family protein n=1 Tax=Tundrisphaera lichenicola TaxID=2029860 RepID=UPI003EBA40C2